MEYGNLALKDYEYKTVKTKKKKRQAVRVRRNTEAMLNRKLGRTSAHRNAMLRGLVTYLLENGSVETTLTRAKEVRSVAEKMITLGKKNTLASRRAALSYITKEDVVTKVFNEIAPKYEGRNGGYTQIYKLGPRRGDGAEMAIIKLVD